MFLDLDKFKHINDEFGHDAGDQLLFEAGQRIQSCIREVDTVARFGGDEFVILFSDLDTNLARATEQAGAIAEKIRHRVDQAFRVVPHLEAPPHFPVKCHCSSSIGVVMFAHLGDTENDILKWGDKAMYVAKNAGGNSVRFHVA